MPGETAAFSSGEERLQQIISAYQEAIAAGNNPDRQELLACHADLAGSLKAFFAEHDQRRQPTLVPASPEAPTLIPGKNTSHSNRSNTIRTLGDYELLAELARGGMGVVYKARQISLNRVVALKMILAGHLASEQDVQRFHSEAEAAATLDHPNIVPIYEVGQHEGQHYFSMTLIDGGSLARVVASGEWRLTKKEGQGKAAELLAITARAVHYAHQRGILHRDLKPANILIDDKARRTSLTLASLNASRTVPT